MALEIHNLQNLIELDLKGLNTALRLSAGEESPDLSLSIVSDEDIRRLNKAHLGHDRATDVLAFDYREEGQGTALCGEVIVSAETALRVSREKNHEAFAELILYVVHGVLHLNGYDDKRRVDAVRMWNRQNEIMRDLGFPENLGPEPE
jgi:probable rRNA maturation factor